MREELSGVQPGRLQQLGHQPRHPGRLAVDDLQRAADLARRERELLLLLADQELDGAEQAGDRRLQLMCRDREELIANRHGLLGHHPGRSFGLGLSAGRSLQRDQARVLLGLLLFIN